MSLTDQMRSHRARCMPHMVRLRLLASGNVGGPVPPGAEAEVARATDAILAEAVAAQRTADKSSHKPGGPSLLAARLARLSAAAEDARSAARDGNVRVMRRELGRFDALTSAMWTVLVSVCTPAKRRRRVGTPLLTSRS